MTELVKKRWFQVIGVLVIIAAVLIVPRVWRLDIAEGGSSAVAEVEGEKITELQFQAAINRRLLRLTAVRGRFSSAEKEDVMLSVFKQMLNDKILEITAKKEGVTVTPEDLAGKREQFIAMLQKMYQEGNDGVPPGFKKQTGKDLYNYLWSTLGFRREMEFLEYLKYEILEEKLSKKLFPESSYTVTDEDIMEYIPVVELRQIFFNYDMSKIGESQDLNFANKKLMREAWQVYDQLRQGADFAQMAELHSQETSAVNGGYIGWINKRSVVPAFWEKASVLDEGEITEPFTTDYGIHILKCIKRADLADPETRRRLDEWKELVKKTVLVRKRKADFVGWFYKKFKQLEEQDEIILYHPVLKANKLRNLGQFDEAIQEYREAIKRDKEGAPYYHLDIAWIMARQRKYSEALREIRKATEMAPTDPLLYFKMGEAYMEVGEHEKAIMEFMKASDMSKLNYDLHKKLMQIFTQLGLPEEASQEQERMRHAVELLSKAGDGSMAPGSFFKSPNFEAPPGMRGEQTPSVTPDLGLDSEESMPDFPDME